MSRNLNGAQVALCFVWADGIYKHVADDPKNWRDATAATDDNLFRYMMQELATDEGCTSKAEATRRLTRIADDILQAAQSL